MERILEKYYDCNSRSQCKMYEPIIKFNFNKPNKNIIFKINGLDDFLIIKNTKYNISESYLQADNTISNQQQNLN